MNRTRSYVMLAPINITRSMACVLSINQGGLWPHELYFWFVLSLYRHTTVIWSHAHFPLFRMLRADHDSNLKAGGWGWRGQSYPKYWQARTPPFLRILIVGCLWYLCVSLLFLALCLYVIIEVLMKSWSCNWNNPPSWKNTQIQLWRKKKQQRKACLYTHTRIYSCIQNFNELWNQALIY